MIRLLIALLLASIPLTVALAESHDAPQGENANAGEPATDAAEAEPALDCNALIEKRATGAQLSLTEAKLLSVCFSMLPPRLAPPEGHSTAYEPEWALRGDPENIVAGPYGYITSEGM